MKGLFFAAAVAATLAIGMPTAAEAAKVKIYLGIPHYGYQVGPDYRFREGYGWYRPVGYHRGRLSCGQARSGAFATWASGMSPRLNAVALPIPLKPRVAVVTLPCS